MRTRAATLKVWAALLGVMAAAMAVVLAAGTQPAKAAFPGSNGAIAFTSDQDGDLEIYRMAPDGFGGPYSAKLTENAIDISNPSQLMTDNLLAWNAEGTRIAFVSTRDDTDGDIFRMDASGNDETNLTNNPATDTSPAWFPTDTKLAFVSNRTDSQNTTDNELYVMTLDENANPLGNLQRIITNAASDEQPAVSPNGMMIAFASNRDGDFEIYVMKANARESRTNRPINFTNNTVSDTNPDWSPNGQRIVFDSERSGSSTEREIVVMNADGTGQKLLTNNSFDDIDPVFSPDGRRIAFESTRAGQFNPGFRDIFRTRADGANQFNLTNTDDTDANPSWQPN
jgi:Tol biopolymer transport system component